MRRSNRLLISSLMLCCGLTLMAVPAKKGVHTVTQPDGSTLRIKKMGDEFHHLTLTEDGMLLAEEADGTMCYARTNTAGLIESTGVKAFDIEKRTAIPAEAMNIKDVNISSLAKSPKRVQKKGLGLDDTTFPGKGSPNVLILLVEYADFSFQCEDPANYFNGMLNEEGFSQYGGTGSCKDYFTENSGGQFTPNFVCYGPVKLPKKRSYYGGNDNWGNDKNPEMMVVDAIEILDDDVDFSIFDNDGDGYVDNVYVIYAGQGEASFGASNTVWPHSWDLSSAGQSLTVDGVKIEHYACSNEWQEDRPDGIGTFCHEFSHVMGLPDLYHTTDIYADYTPDAYSVLDYGPYNNDGCTPPAYSIYERNALGWCEPEVIDGPLNGSLEHILTSNKGYIIPTSKDTEFFLLENRQQEGWDKYIPGHGMLIWHIDFNKSVWESNTVNNTRGHQYVDIEEACGLPSADPNSQAGYTFPGTHGITEFTDDTRPSMRMWSGTGLNMPITDIAEADGIITFKVAGGDNGVPKVQVPEPFAAEDIEISADYFIAAWQPVEHAVDYHVSVYASGEGESFTSTNNMGDYGTLSMAEGWSTNSVSKYDSTSNYGLESPSLKMASDGVWLLSPEYQYDVTKISYWRKGQTTDGNSTLDVKGLVNGTWTDISTETLNANDEGSTVTLTDIPAGVRQVKFIYNKVKGNLALDDVTIQVGTEDTLLEDYNECSTGGATTLRVDKLKEGCRTYTFKVRAAGESRVSAYCKPVKVTLPEPAGISNVEAADGNTEYFDMLGRRVLNPAPGQILIRRTSGKVSKVVIR